MAHEAVVIEKAGSGLRDLIEVFCQQAGVTLSIPYEIDEACNPFCIRRGRAWCWFYPCADEKKLDEKVFSCLRLMNPICERTLGVAWQEKRYLSQVALAFHQFVIDYFDNLEQEGPSLN